MKKILFLSLLAAGIITANAQENKVVSAKMHLDEYMQDPNDSSALRDAKDAIDLAAANDKTKDEPKMWLYRGNVYRVMFDRSFSMVKNKLLAKLGGKPTPQDISKANGQAYTSIDTTAICVATNSYLRVIQLEPTKAYADEARQWIPECQAHIENQAQSYYYVPNYPVALGLYKKALAMGVTLGIKDTADYMVRNVQNCAVTADKVHDNATAIYYYQKLIDLQKMGAKNTGKSQPYTAMLAIYNNMKDTAKAMDMLKKGRAAYPDDVNLLIAETNYYLTSGQTDKAVSNLQEAINKLVMINDPKNSGLLANLYFVLGNAYDRMANPKDANDKPLPKPANFDDLFNKAEDNYKKAVALTPDNFDQEYDLGALYNNRASALNKEANDVPPEKTDLYNKLLAQANSYLKLAQPPLEKAHTINPTDQATVHALLQIYASTGQTDKIQALKAGK